MDLAGSIRRCLALLPLLRKDEGMRADELARMTGQPAERLIQELGDVLLMCGVPPYYPHNYIGLWMEGDRVFARYADQFRRPVRLTMEEALALILALRAYTRSLEHPFAEAAGGIREKIRAVMPAGERAALDQLERRVDVRAQAGAVERKIGTLRDAMARNRVCHIVYYTAGRHELNERDVWPYGLVEHRGTWYLVAYCERREKEIPFRVDRIKSIVLLDRTYDVPDEFDVAQYRREEMYFPTAKDITVKIRFDEPVARLVREQSPRGTVRPGPRGSVIRTLRTQQPRFAVDLALTYMPHAEILEPEDVRALMRQVCDEVLAAYERGEEPEREKPAGRAPSRTGTRKKRKGAR